MARVYAGEVLGLVKPTAGQTVELKVFMQDSTGAALTGQTFNAAGMAVAVAKPGAAYVAWLTIVGSAFATGNWQEVGYGVYNIVLAGSTAGEANLLDTPGDLMVYVKNTASKGDNFLFRVVPADVARLTAAASANLQAGYDGTGYAGGTIKQRVVDGSGNAIATAAVNTELRLAELDAANLPADVTAIPTTAMRGTDSAYTGTPPTAIAITTTVWAHASAVAIKVVTDKLATMLEAAGAAWRWTTGALVNAPGAGGGDYALTVTVVDGDGDPVADAVVTAVNTAGDTTLAGPLVTDTNGQRIFYRPDGETAKVNVRSTALIGAGTAAYTMAGNTAVTVTVALAALPVPTDPATYALYNDETDDHRVALGAGEAVIVLEWVEDAGLTDAEAGKGLSLLGKEFPTDATGRWSMNIPDFWAELGLAIRIRRTLTTITQNNESTWMATLVEPIAPATTINFAALAPDLFE